MSCSRQDWSRCALLFVLLVLPGTLQAEPSAGDLRQVAVEMQNLLSSARFLEPMRSKLDFFQTAFTAVGMAAVMISSIRRVARARSGEESLGWVSGMVMTVALMVVQPAVGARVFSVCDELAATSGYNGAETIRTTWNVLLVLLPNESPAKQELQAQHVAPKTPLPDKKTTLKNVVWNLFAEAWNNVTESFAAVFGALTSITNRILVFLIILIPSIVLLLGALLTAIGGFARDFFRECMDVFMPMMIGMLALSPMRGAATSFVLKYISVALWPVAWAVWNSISVSLLLCTMQWVIDCCQSVVSTLSVLPELANEPEVLSQVPPGYFSAVALLLPWNLQIFFSLTIAFVSALLTVGTVAAPAALTKTLTHGACFVRDQVGQAVKLLATTASTVTTSAGGAGGGIASALGAGGARSFAFSVSRGLNGVAARLEPMPGLGGAVGRLAAAGSRLVGRSADSGTAGMAEAASSQSGPTDRRAPVSFSIMACSSGPQSAALNSPSPAASPSGVRSHRRGSSR